MSSPTRLHRPAASSITVAIPGAVRVRGGGFVTGGAQNQALRGMVNTDTVGARALSTYDVHMPPGHVSSPHYHRHGELVVHVLDGHAATVVWSRGEPHLIHHGPNDHLYVAAGVPHAAINLSTRASVYAVEVRAHPDDNADVIALPELNEALTELAASAQREHQDVVAAAQARGAHSW